MVNISNRISAAIEFGKLNQFNIQLLKNRFRGVGVLAHSRRYVTADEQGIFHFFIPT
jgi:hypothetical protein